MHWLALPPHSSSNKVPGLNALGMHETENHLYFKYSSPSCPGLLHRFCTFEFLYLVLCSHVMLRCLKEDPATMSLLQRSLDPEKTLGLVDVLYTAVFDISRWKDRK